MAADIPVSETNRGASVPLWRGRISGGPQQSFYLRYEDKEARTGMTEQDDDRAIVEAIPAMLRRYERRIQRAQGAAARLSADGTLTSHRAAAVRIVAALANIEFSSELHEIEKALASMSEAER